MTEPHPAYLLMSHLIRALSHKIRTPLSVISNDLHFIASTHTGLDVQRPIGKVTDIAEILSGLVALVSQSPRIELHALDSVLMDAGFQGGYGEDLQIQCDRTLTVQGLKTLTTLMDFSIIGAAQFGKFIILEIQGKLASNSLSSEFSLFTQLFNETLQYQQVTPPLIDALFDASNILVRGTVSGEVVKVQLQFSE